MKKPLQTTTADVLLNIEGEFSSDGLEINDEVEFIRLEKKEEKEEVLIPMEPIRVVTVPAPIPRTVVYMGTFWETSIAQAVHAIEFVFSIITHTASYLRIWALSLAHTQLSEMLWTTILSKAALQDSSSTGIFKLILMFPLWATLTVSILIVMEGLSAFLHALRLHWVEFMTKFHEGGGYPFRPFCFKNIYSKHDKVDIACKPNKRDHYGINVLPIDRHIREYF